MPDAPATGYRLLGGLRLVMAAVVLAALVTQIVNGFSRPSFSLVNFFSFFTVESNVFAMVMTAIAGLQTLRASDHGELTACRGAATLYMTITGVVYVLLLSGLEESLQTPTPWVNTVLHYLMPIFVLADWLVDRRLRPLDLRVVLWWLVFPLAYLAYSLLRGPLVGWYPYPFLNPAPHGYGRVAVAAIAIAVFAAALALVLAWTSRLGARKKVPT